MHFSNEMRSCAFCGLNFYPSIYNPRTLTCSKQCSVKYQGKRAVESGRKREYSKRWTERYGEKKKKMDLEYVNQWRYGGNKYKVLERDGYSCQHCGEINLKSLVVHHKDEIIENTEMDNLVTLCRGCHAKHHHSGMQNVKYKNVSKESVIQAIQSSPNLEEAARKLGITRKTLRKKRELYGLPDLDKHGNPTQVQ